MPNALQPEATVVVIYGLMGMLGGADGDDAPDR